MVTTDFNEDRDTANSLAVQADGKILAVGIGGGGFDFILVRYNTDGTLDTTFEDNGIAVLDAGFSRDTLVDVAVQPNGQILAVGNRSPISNLDFALVRYLGDVVPPPLVDDLLLSAPVINENATVTLTGTITDENPDEYSVEVWWGDGTTSLASVDPVSRTFTATHQYLDNLPGEAEANIVVFVGDGAGQSGAAYTSVLIRNVDPTLDSLTSDAQTLGNATPGTPLSLSASFTDVGTLDTHTASDLWGDGSVAELATVHEANGSGTIFAEHTYEQGGVFTVTVQLQDSDGATTQQSIDVYVTGVGVNDGVLQIVGDQDRNRVQVQRFFGRYRVKTDFHPTVWVKVSEVERIEVVAGAGDDRISLSPFVSVESFVAAGAGDDVVFGGSGPNVIVGGDGDDRLYGGVHNDIILGGVGRDRIYGGFGRDILIGGLDRDRLFGGFGDDILIGGSTTFDEDAQRRISRENKEVYAILNLWLTNDPAPTRKLTIENAVIGLVLGETVLDDKAADVLFGGFGNDWGLLFNKDRFVDFRTRRGDLKTRE